MKLTATFVPQTLSATIQAPTMGTACSTPIARSFVDRDPYDGPYSVTPTTEAQVLNTVHKRMTDDLVINPIPSNFGRIEFDGSVMTIS